MALRLLARLHTRQHERARPPPPAHCELTPPGFEPALPTPSRTFLPPRFVFPWRTLDPKEREITTGTLVLTLSPGFEPASPGFELVPSNQRSRIPTVILPRRSTFCVIMEGSILNIHYPLSLLCPLAIILP